ncbi:hypothetical protein ACFPTX_04430 [Pseudomonas sp. GCM10022188]|uniref:hypothetical protein n=1 Tax=Pseudomonas TaxID=286 RepID=UPI001E3C4F56|nr:hypothetical protein [Pseudomonas oryzagri]MCC6076929.1 hypothetical protein [Pseudomonas oryzagri]
MYKPLTTLSLALALIAHQALAAPESPPAQSATGAAMLLAANEGKTNERSTPAKQPQATNSATPAIPATPAVPGGPGTPATPAIPATPAVPNPGNGHGNGNASRS